MVRHLLLVIALLGASVSIPLPAAAEQKTAKASKSSRVESSAKGKSKSASKRKSAKSKPSARAVASPNAPRPVVRQVVIRTESELQREVAGARSTLAQDPGNAAARETLAQAAIITVDLLLAAEGIGSAAKAERLTVFLTRELSDVGPRVQKIAQQGDFKAKQALGVFYGRGLVLARDPQKSCAEFKAAAEQLPGASWHWAQCNLESSPDDAWAQMERAALQGHAAAQEWIGRRCLGEFGAAGKDFVCAREWLGQSASQGRPRSQTLFAYLLNSGQGGPIDASRAVRLYKLAAEQGDTSAQNNLGEIYESGRGVEKNLVEALLWYERAADAGFAPGLFNAGRLLAIGVGDRADPAKARAWLVQAEQKGIVQARQVLDWLDQRAGSAAPPVVR